MHWRRCTVIKYNSKNVILAKNLRRRATPQEKHLWYDFLSKYEVRFQRQKPIADFIADFYCHQAKLVIEIDGFQHLTYSGATKDKYRTEILNDLGLTVIRFTNNQIDKEFFDVCNYIDETVKKIIKNN